jgi:hypothetical protein
MATSIVGGSVWNGIVFRASSATVYYENLAPENVSLDNV